MIKENKTRQYRFFSIFFGISLLLFLLEGCNNNNPGTVTDIDGNVYHTVTIGSQVWMVENLKVTRYRNGDPIPNVTSRVQWSTEKNGAYCNYNNNDTNASIYGRLYNWYAVNDNRNIAPQGWHVPSDQEFKTLIHYLGGDSVAGGKVKESGILHWLNPNTGATNKYGISALPAGYRNSYDGTFRLIGHSSFWWSSTENDTTVWIRIMSFSDAGAFRNYVDKLNGASIRCIKD
jgi:uncharacterized protein (TIGR02145 family)